MKRILITGGNGYIGKTLTYALQAKYSVVSITRMEFDLSNPYQTKHWFDDKYFDVVIHTAIRGGSRLVPDNSDVLDNNLKMYYNLLDNRSHYDRLINIGSGAELYAKDTPYGLSKHVIRQSLLSKDNFYNIRVFAIFNEDELDTRFIKSNILKYINGVPMTVFKNRLMDCFYINDFVSLIDFYIQQEDIPKEYDCCYENHHTLLDIAHKINTLGDYIVPIEVINPLEVDIDYVGEYKPLPIVFSGLDVGLQNVYKQLLCKK